MHYGRGGVQLLRDELKNGVIVILISLITGLLKLSARRAWVFVLGGLLGGFLLQFVPAFRDISFEPQYFILLPLLWLNIALYALWGWVCDLNNRPKLNPLLAMLAIAAGILTIIGALISGRLWGFGYSPYTRQFPDLLGYLIYVTFTMVGLEMARAYLLYRWFRRAPGIAFTLTVFIFTLLSVPPGGYTQLFNGSATFITLGKTFLPILAQNLLLTYLAWIGGPGMVILFRFLPLAFEWLSPILPDPNWVARMFFNTLLPIVVLVLVNIVVTWADKQNKRHEKSPRAWLYTALFAASLLWFNTGLFGMRTYLIAGGSMQPNLKAGDVVIVQKGAAEDIQIGDVILFSDESKAVLHRVIEIKRTADGVEFVTQGDANNTADAPVRFHQVEGKAILKLPKIGWLSLQLKGLLAWLI